MQPCEVSAAKVASGFNGNEKEDENMSRALLVVWLAALGGAAALAAQEVKSKPDLAPTAVWYAANGAVALTIANRGVAIAAPFAIDVYLDADTRRTLRFTGDGSRRGGGTGPGPTSLTPGVRSTVNKLALPFQQGESRTIVLDNFKVELCSGDHSLRVVADPGVTIAEAYENNNELTRTLGAPCPDLVVVSIKKNYNSSRTQYVAEVTVKNQGTGGTAHFSIATWAEGGSGPFSAAPAGGATAYEPLAPGQVLTLRTGSAHALESLRVKVWLDVGNMVKEGNEDNNVVEKLLMP